MAMLYCLREEDKVETCGDGEEWICGRRRREKVGIQGVRCEADRLSDQFVVQMENCMR